MENWIFQGIMVSIALLQVIVLVAIKLNDIKHIDQTIMEIKEQLKDIQQKVLEHERRLSRIEGKFNNE